jgi:hypothetical protein
MRRWGVALSARSFNESLFWMQERVTRFICGGRIGLNRTQFCTEIMLTWLLALGLWCEWVGACQIRDPARLRIQLIATFRSLLHSKRLAIKRCLNKQSIIYAQFEVGAFRTCSGYFGFLNLVHSVICWGMTQYHVKKYASLSASYFCS